MIQVKALADQVKDATVWSDAIKAHNNSRIHRSFNRNNTGKGVTR